MLSLIIVLATRLAAASTTDLHVYRHALRTLGAAGTATPADLPAHFIVARTFNEGLARLKPNPWYAVRSGWHLEFEGAIQARLGLPTLKINDVLLLTVGDERRVFLEVRHRATRFGPYRFALIELRFDGVDRVALVPLRFDLPALHEDNHAYRRIVRGPEWARVKIIEFDNQTSPERLVGLTRPDDDRRLVLTPADDVGHARLRRFLVRHEIKVVTTPSERRPACVPHLRLVR